MNLLETTKSGEEGVERGTFDLQKIGNLGGIQELIEQLGKGDWASLVGGIMTLWKEYFGTPEEKAEIARARREQKEEKTQKDTVQRLQTLRDKVDKKDEKDSKEEDVADVKVLPYKPGQKEPTLSPKESFRAQIEEIYARHDTIYTIHNMREYFGKEYRKFMIKKDPVTGEEPLTFLGRPINGGINMITLPFLRIAEHNLMRQGLNYIPAQKEILGFQDRPMCLGVNDDGTPIYDPKIPSFHKYGLAVDLDHDSNWPRHGRGNIPDEVMIAMTEAGFNLGIMGDRTAASYLINDPMHFQMRFPPDSPAGQEIINESSIGRQYWNTIKPMIEAIKGVA